MAITTIPIPITTRNSINQAYNKIDVIEMLGKENEKYIIASKTNSFTNSNISELYTEYKTHGTLGLESKLKQIEQNNQNFNDIFTTVVIITILLFVALFSWMTYSIFK